MVNQVKHKNYFQKLKPRKITTSTHEVKHI